MDLKIGVEKHLNEKIETRVVEHRNRFKKLMFGRYVELLPLLINYKNIETTGIDPIQLENGLRNGYQVVVGKARNGVIMVLGYITNTLKHDAINYVRDFNYTYEKRLTQDDITYIVPEYLRPKKAMEIQYYDGCESGDFVVIRNKPLYLIHDYEIVEHYTDELAEITLSRFSLIMQSKFAKLFKSEINDETINQFISQLYNGAPFIKTSKTFNADADEIVDIGSEYITTALAQLKREYQNKISELSNFLGVNSLGVDKESGVSKEEAESNDGFTTANSNVYLKGREPMKMLSKRFNLDIKPYYNDEVASELGIIQTLKNSDVTNQ